MEVIGMDEHTSPPSACPSVPRRSTTARPSRRSETTVTPRWRTLGHPSVDGVLLRHPWPNKSEQPHQLHGCLLADKQPGAFSLRILSVTGVPGENGEPLSMIGARRAGRGHRARGTAVQSGDADRCADIYDRAHDPLARCSRSARQPDGDRRGGAAGVAARRRKKSARFCAGRSTRGLRSA